MVGILAGTVAFSRSFTVASCTIPVPRTAIISCGARQRTTSEMMKNGDYAMNR